MTDPNAIAKFLAVEGNVIAGAVVLSASGETLAVENPATGEIIARIPAGGGADIERAVKAARASFERGDWSRADPSHRGRVLWALASMLREKADALAHVETVDSGKPIAEARIDILGALSHLPSKGSLAGKSGSATSLISLTTTLADEPV
jgi:acyl-CoA reductase-like NAD-dependent aldehyde dehydrogenase